MIVKPINIYISSVKRFLVLIVMVHSIVQELDLRIRWPEQYKYLISNKSVLFVDIITDFFKPFNIISNKSYYTKLLQQYT